MKPPWWTPGQGRVGGPMKPPPGSRPLSGPVTPANYASPAPVTPPGQPLRQGLPGTQGLPGGQAQGGFGPHMFGQMSPQQLQYTENMLRSYLMQLQAHRRMLPGIPPRGGQTR